MTYNFQRHQYLLKELDNAFLSIERPENADKADEQLRDSARFSRMAAKLEVKPFVLTEEQKNELLNVDVDIEELGELHFPFDNFCIELGDGETFLPGLEAKFSLDQHMTNVQPGFSDPASILKTKLMYVMKTHGDKYIVYDVAEYQLKRMNELRKSLKKNATQFSTQSIDFMSHGYAITASDINETMRDIAQASRHTFGGAVADQTASAEAVRENLEGKLKFLYVFCKYLESDNVELVRKLVHITPNKTKQKELKKRGMADILEILEPRVILTKKQQHTVAMHVSHGEGAKHSFMYDVRGHFKKIKLGRLAGRHIWCPPHRRGLANTTYRPAIRAIE